MGAIPLSTSWACEKMEVGYAENRGIVVINVTALSLKHA